MEGMEHVLHWRIADSKTDVKMPGQNANLFRGPHCRFEWSFENIVWSFLVIINLSYAMLNSCYLDHCYCIQCTFRINHQPWTVSLPECDPTKTLLFRDRLAFIPQKVCFLFRLEFLLLLNNLLSILFRLFLDFF